MSDYIPCGKNGCRNGWVINEVTNLSTRCQCKKDYDASMFLFNHGIPRDYIDKTLDNFIPRHEMERAHVAGFKEYVSEFATKSLFNGRGLYIFSRIKRTGKTHCAVGIARAILEKNYDKNNPVNWVYFVNVSELFEMLWDKVSMEKGGSLDGNIELRRIREVLAKIKNCKLLILDDLGVTRKTDFVTNTLYTIIEYRMANNKPIVATSNCTLGEIHKAYGEDGERIAKRLNEKVKVKEFYGAQGERR